MSTEKIREGFETAFIEMMVERHGEGYRSSAAYMLSEKDDSGDYRSGITFFALWAWQASRAAIEVELPAYRKIRHMPMPDENESYNEAVENCRDAIESLGLKVKP